MSVLGAFQNFKVSHTISHTFSACFDCSHIRSYSVYLSVKPMVWPGSPEIFRIHFSSSTASLVSQTLLEDSMKTDRRGVLFAQAQISSYLQSCRTEIKVDICDSLYHSVFVITLLGHILEAYRRAHGLVSVQPMEDMHGPLIEAWGKDVGLHRASIGRRGAHGIEDSDRNTELP